MKKIIGIDVATKNEKTGLALAVYQDHSYRLMDLRKAVKDRPFIDSIEDWLDPDDDLLLAMDAPLGWPSPMASLLADHEAGKYIDCPANLLFRRETDREVYRLLKKTPMDVGAERIARTALRALAIIEEIRDYYKKSIPLAWTAQEAIDWRAIEVYPAALLRSRHLKDRSYKGKERIDARRQLLPALESELPYSHAQSLALLDSDDVFDAYVCILAGMDFLAGRAHPPKDLGLAKKEGWIWFRPPA